ncbi:MAG TPA: phosphoribosylglycinamide formyltransferase [Spirochaetia bacterium]|nr:phosphoribosylglycinamide formyltransferase [Spirochaetia bacterium]
MARFAVLASGAGTNFQALAAAFTPSGPHELVAVISDRRSAPVLSRAQLLGIPAYYLPYAPDNRKVFERAAITILSGLAVDLVVLAGFMRVLTSLFVDAFSRRIINIHPSLLPKYPGTHAIEKSYRSKDTELGVTVHFVDAVLDGGEVIAQESFVRSSLQTIDEVEQKIHEIEHRLYPEVVRNLLEEQIHGRR